MDKKQTLQHNWEVIESWGVECEHLIDIIHENQISHMPDLTFERIVHSLDKVLSRTRVRHAIDTADALDDLSKSDDFGAYMYVETGEDIENDAGVFGLDETIALSICTSELSRTNFGYIDKTKPNVVADLNAVEGNTFKDDIICAVAAETADQLALRDEF